jgi:hypothetical protein
MASHHKRFTCNGREWKVLSRSRSVSNRHKQGRSEVWLCGCIAPSLNDLHRALSTSSATGGLSHAIPLLWLSKVAFGCHSGGVRAEK